MDRVVQDRASHFFKFRAEFDARRQNSRIGNALPLEFSAAGYRFGHSMVRAFYDYNKNFGRPGVIRPKSTLNCCSASPVEGQLDHGKRLPKVWVIDWTRFVGAAPHDSADGLPARVARKIDTALSPPLKTMVKEGNDVEDALKPLFKSLARRNLRRGYNLRLPTGQALHRHLKQNGAVHPLPSPTYRPFLVPSRRWATSSRTPSPSSTSGRRCGSIFWQRRKKAAATNWVRWAVS